MSDSTESSEGAVGTSDPKPGDELAGARLVELVGREFFKTVWRAEEDGGAPVAVHVFAAGLTPEELDVFRTAGEALVRFTREKAHPGVLWYRRLAAEGTALVSDLWTVGAVADLPALGWGLDQRLILVEEVCAALSALHAAGIVHGSLRPASILFNDDLRPVIADVGLVDVGLSLAGDEGNAQGFGSYASPESRYGMAMDARSDVFSVGRLLHFLLLDRDPPASDEPLPRLDSINHAPAGLVRIIRKCTVPDPEQRYGSIAELHGDLARWAQAADEVGLKHPDVQEGRTSGIFTPGTAPGTQPAPVAAPKSKPLPLPPRPSKAGAAPAKGAAGKPGAKPGAAKAGTPEPELPLKPRRLAAMSGALVLCVCILWGLFGLPGGFVMRFVGALGGALVPLATGLAGARTPAIVVSVVGAALAFLANPVGLGASLGGDRALGSGDSATAARALRNMSASGRKEFANIQLRDADLTNVHLDGAHLDWADLTGCNLAGATLVGARLIGARFGGANLAGADLHDADVMMGEELDKAACDGATVLPASWVCTDGHPAHASSAPAPAASK